MGVKLLDGITGADQNGSWFPIRSVNGDTIHSVCCYSGDFDGGTITIQWSPDDGTNAFTVRRVDESQAIFTVSDVYNVRAVGGLVRAILTGSGGSTTALTVVWF